MDNLEDDVGTEEAGLRLGEAEEHHENVEERRGPLEDGEEDIVESEGEDERSQTSQTDGRLHAGHDVAASEDLGLQSNNVILPHIHYQARGEEEHAQTSHY